MKIEWQRCFQIPKEKLDVFLVKVRMMDSNQSYFQCDYIFQEGDHYDVVVCEYKGSYPFQRTQIENFVEDLKTPPKFVAGRDYNDE